MNKPAPSLRRGGKKGKNMMYKTLEESSYTRANGHQEIAKIVQSDSDIRIIYFDSDKKDIHPNKTYKESYPDIDTALSALKRHINMEKQ